MAIGAGQKSYPFNYNAIVSFVPRQSGVYVLFNELNWFAVGESDDLADDLFKQLLSRSQADRHRVPATFQFEVVVDNAARKARVNQLSEGFQFPPAR